MLYYIFKKEAPLLLACLADVRAHAGARPKIALVSIFPTAQNSPKALSSMVFGAQEPQEPGSRFSCSKAGVISIDGSCWLLPNAAARARPGASRDEALNLGV